VTPIIYIAPHLFHHIQRAPKPHRGHTAQPDPVFLFLYIVFLQLLHISPEKLASTDESPESGSFLFTPAGVACKDATSGVWSGCEVSIVRLLTQYDDFQCTLGDSRNKGKIPCLHVTQINSKNCQGGLISGKFIRWKKPSSNPQSVFTWRNSLNPEARRPATLFFNYLKPIQPIGERFQNTLTNSLHLYFIF